MPRSPFSRRPRRQTALDRYLAELVDYGGQPCTRFDVMRDLRRCGLDDRAIDRYLQGAELRQRLQSQRLCMRPLTSLLQ